jgi:hypothetical protein
VQVAACARRPRHGRVNIAVALLHVFPSPVGRHQYLDGLAGEFLARVAEKPPGLSVGEGDPSGLVRHDDGHGRRIHHVLEILHGRVLSFRLESFSARSGTIAI